MRKELKKDAIQYSSNHLTMDTRMDLKWDLSWVVSMRRKRVEASVAFVLTQP